MDSSVGNSPCQFGDISGWSCLLVSLGGLHPKQELVGYGNAIAKLYVVSVNKNSNHK